MVGVSFVDSGIGSPAETDVLEEALRFYDSYDSHWEDVSETDSEPLKVFWRMGLGFLGLGAVAGVISVCWRNPWYC